MHHWQTWCWQDLFVYQQCCDTGNYGAKGFELCFQQVGLSFERCCPAKGEPLAQKVGMDIFPSFWDGGRHKGCSSLFFWLPLSLATHITVGPRYHPKTGEVIGDIRGNGTFEALQARLGAKDLGFGSFLMAIARYYAFREVSVDLLTMHREIIAHFGDALQECTPAALLCGLFQAELLYDHDRRGAAKMARDMKFLLYLAVRADRAMAPGPQWETAQYALDRLHVLSTRPRLARRLTVDFVIPLCSATDMEALAIGLQAVLPGGSSGEHVGAAAAMRLHLYDVCSLLDRPQRGLAALEGLLSNLSLATQRLFGRFDNASGEEATGSGTSRLAVRIWSLDEEVPTGDVAAYLRHLADAATSGTLGDVTFLLHPDFLEHVRPTMLSQILASMSRGSWPHDEVDFMYLGWRHEGPVQLGNRVASHVQYHCDMDATTSRLGLCDANIGHPLAAGATFGYNPALLENLWRLAFRRPFNATTDHFGGYDFSQLLVSRRAAQQRPPSYWRYLSNVVSARSSYELLPATRFVSSRIDLSHGLNFNKGVCVWFEHFWHLLFDRRFFPDEVAQDLRAFTRLGDPELPLGLRGGPDSVMQRHYWLGAHDQCAIFRDAQGCHLKRIEAGWTRATAPLSDLISGDGPRDKISG